MSSNKMINNRNLPTGNEVLMNKKFNYEVLISMLIESNWNGDLKEDHRYIYKNNVNFKELAKQAGVSLNTFKTGLNNLVKLGYVDKKIVGDEEVFVIPQNIKVEIYYLKLNF